MRIITFCHRPLLLSAPYCCPIVLFRISNYLQFSTINYFVEYITACVNKSFIYTIQEPISIGFRDIWSKHEKFNYH